MRLMPVRWNITLGGAFTGAIVAMVLGCAAALADASAEHRVEIAQFAFSPVMLQVKKGDVVRFINLDPVPHTATDEEGAWDTANLSKGEHAQIKFDQAGIFEVICVYHPTMRGQIKVTEN